MPAWVLSPLASAELEDILRFIAEDSGSDVIAAKVLDDFTDALDLLAVSPGIGWHREQLTGPDIRWWRVHSYLLAYSPLTKPLRVIRVLHSSRDLERLFRGDD